MRRVSAKYARPGMVLGRAVYDSRGFLVFEHGTTLDEGGLTNLEVHGVGEILVEDWRVSDVPVQPLIAPELEAEAVVALRQLMTEGQGSRSMEASLLEEPARAIYAMTRDLYPDVVGEPNASGCFSLEDYNCVQPVKAASLSLLMGRRLGYRMVDLSNLGIAALFMNIGFLRLARRAMGNTGSLTEEPADVLHEHPRYGFEILSEYGRFDPAVAEAILQHHERWDGSGHPRGLKGCEIASFSRILAIADSYYELVSVRPHRKALMPHEAVEFTMAYSGEMFDPELVQLFARQIPLYPTGVTVKLSTGEVGIVSDANLGHIGRPVVRVCYDEDLGSVKEPYDIDLSLAEHQDRLVVQVLEY